MTAAEMQRLAAPASVERTEHAAPEVTPLSAMTLKRFSAASEVPAGGGGALTADHSITAGVPRG